MVGTFHHNRSGTRHRVVEQPTTNLTVVGVSDVLQFRVDIGQSVRDDLQLELGKDGSETYSKEFRRLVLTTRPQDMRRSPQNGYRAG